MEEGLPGGVEGRTNRGKGHQTRDQGNKIDRAGIRDTHDAGSRDKVTGTEKTLNVQCVPVNMRHISPPPRPSFSFSLTCIVVERTTMSVSLIVPVSI